MHGCDAPFTTTNYGVTTTPRDEYEITMGKKDCPDKNMKDRKGKLVRMIQKIADLKMLGLTKKAKLEDIEIIAVVRNLGSFLFLFLLHSYLVSAAGALHRTHVPGPCLYTPCLYYSYSSIFPPYCL